jgi:regulator of sirC expression with transglutaminase-like and TPR domain
MDQASITREFERLSAIPDREVDLARGALLIAATEYPDLDVERELGLLDALAGAASARLDGTEDPLRAANALSKYLFDEVGFDGNREDYYDPRNSYLHEVLRRRLGIPITLSLVYVEVGKRLGLSLVGVGMPGHFLVKHEDIGDLYIDPFHGGILLSEDECAQRLREVTSQDIPWDSTYLEPIANRDFLTRILRNLKAAYSRRQEPLRVLSVLDLLVALRPDICEERRDRGILHYRLERFDDALEDLRHYAASEDGTSVIPEVRGVIAELERLTGA